MAVDRSVLESSWRLARIKNIKKYFYILQAIVTVVVAIFLIYFYGPSFNPLYVPLDACINFIIIMLLLISIEAFAFRLLELKYSKTDSVKFLIANYKLAIKI